MALWLLSLQETYMCSTVQTVQYYRSFQKVLTSNSVRSSWLDVVHLELALGADSDRNPGWQSAVPCIAI